MHNICIPKKMSKGSLLGEVLIAVYQIDTISKSKEIREGGSGIFKHYPDLL